MTTISLCMIVKNEAETLAKCLSSVQHIVDEMVIVDTGSTDAIEIAAGKQQRNTSHNMQIYRKRLQAGETLSDRDLYNYANELFDHALFEEAAAVYEQFWDCRQAWVEDRITACLRLAACYGQLGRRDLQLQVLFRTFELDTPRAEICCSLGACFIASKEWRLARYWYLAATALGEPPTTGVMIDPAAWTWLPHVQLCVCFDQLGQYEKANHHNEIARTFQPEHASIVHNKAYLAKVLQL